MSPELTLIWAGILLALVLFELEGRSVDDIAAMCGCAVNTVWTRIHRARTQLEELTDILQK